MRWPAALVGNICAGWIPGWGFAVADGQSFITYESYRAIRGSPVLGGRRARGLSAAAGAVTPPPR